MLRINFKHSIATVAVIAGALAVAGPASASSTPLENTMVSSVVESQYVPTSAGVNGTAHERGASAGFKSLSGMDSETEFMDYTDDALFDSARPTGLKVDSEVTDYVRTR